MASLYMLDTDTCAFILRRSSQALLERIQAVPLERQVMSIAYPRQPLMNDASFRLVQFIPSYAC